MAQTKKLERQRLYPEKTIIEFLLLMGFFGGGVNFKYASEEMRVTITDMN